MWNEDVDKVDDEEVKSIQQPKALADMAYARLAQFLPKAGSPSFFRQKESASPGVVKVVGETKPEHTA